MQRASPAAVTLLLSGLLLIGLAASRIVFPYDVGYNVGGAQEANAWAPASLLSHLHNPYAETWAVHPPYTAPAYGPVYYAIVGVGLRLFGNQYWFMRCVSLVAALTAAWLLFVIARRFAHDRFSPRFGAALLLAQYPMLYWAGIQRPDVLALAFMLLGLALALRNREAERWWHPICSALALIGAVLSRQSYVIPFLVVGAWYLLEGNYRALWRFAATVLVVGGGIVAALSLTSHGGLTTDLIVNQAHVPSSLAVLTHNLKALAESPVTWLTVFLLVVVATAWLRGGSRAGIGVSRSAERTRQRAGWLLFAYLVAATSLGLVTGAHGGSNINYFIEPLAVACLLLGVAGTSALALTSAHRRMAAVLVLCAGAAVITARQAHGELLRWQSKPYFDEVVASIRRIPPSAGPMYSDYPELVDEAGRTSYVNDHLQYDGRSTPFKGAFERLFASRKLAVIISGERSAPSGYVRVTLRRDVPTGVYIPFLYMRRGL